MKNHSFYKVGYKKVLKLLFNTTRLQSDDENISKRLVYLPFRLANAISIHNSYQYLVRLAVDYEKLHTNFYLKSLKLSCRLAK